MPYLLDVRPLGEGCRWKSVSLEVSLHESLEETAALDRGLWADPIPHLEAWTPPSTSIIVYFISATNHEEPLV